MRSGRMAAPRAGGQNARRTAIIDAEGTPWPKVMNGLMTLEGEQLFELLTPFVPVPLIERAREKGYDAWSEEREPGSCAPGSQGMNVAKADERVLYGRSC